MDEPIITTLYGDPYVAVMYCNFIDVYNGGADKQEKLQGGGAIYFRKMKLYVAYGKFENCSCHSGYGGAIYCDVESPLEVDTVVFSSCTSAPQYKPETSGGGAIAAKDTVTVDRSKFYDCICENQNTNIHGGALYCGFGETQASLLGIHTSRFERCAAPGVGVVFPGFVRNFALGDCDFIDCTSNSSAAIFEYSDKQGSTCLLEMEDCVIENCQGASMGSIMKATGLLLLEMKKNFFNCSLPYEVHNAIILQMIKPKLVISVEHCNFTNNGKRMGQEWVSGRKQDGGFINIDSSQKNVSFIGCSFDGIVKDGVGAGLNLELASDGVLAVSSCTFTNLQSTSAPAISTGTVYDTSGTKMTTCLLKLEWCVFDTCVADGGTEDGFSGAVAVMSESPGGIIHNCTFRNNACSSGAKCLYLSVYTQKNWYLPKLDIADCSFEDHQSDGLIWIHDITALVQLPEEKYSIHNCKFINNKFGDGTDGVVKLENLYFGWFGYDNCQFIDNQAKNGLTIFGQTTLNPGYFLTHCFFENCQADAGLVAIANSNALYLLLEVCTFVDCVSDVGSAVLATTKAESVTISFSTFVGCRGNEPLIKVSCLQFTLANCTFDQSINGLVHVQCKAANLLVNFMNTTSQAQKRPLSIDVSEGTTNISDLILNMTDEATVLSAGALTGIELSVGAGASIAFSKGCFSSSDEAHDKGAVGPYITIHCEGLVTFSDMCFDTNKTSAIDKTGNGNVEFQGNEDSYFGECVCKADTPTIPVSPTDEPDQDSGNRLSDGAIAGIVIAILLLIAIIIIILILFVLRRRKRNTSSEEGDDAAYQDDPGEVTITTLDDNDQPNKDWAIVTEERPFALSQDNEDNAFGTTFEEN